MDWKLYGLNGEFLKDVNCEYDACDISRWEFGASELRLDFDNKKAYVVDKEGGDSN